MKNDPTNLTQIEPDAKAATLETVAPPLRVAIGFCDEAPKVVGLSRSAWLAADARGLTPRGFSVGRRRLIAVEELQAWAAAGGPSRRQWETQWREIQKRNR